MRGVEVFDKLLTKEEKFKFIDNVGITTLFHEEMPDPGMLITHAFNWEQTPEGFTYWLEVASRLSMWAPMVPTRYIEKVKL